jgi:SMODS-associating 2TM, beta-strand rich effector domain
MTTLTLTYAELLLLLRAFALSSAVIGAVLALLHAHFLQTDFLSAFVRYLGVGITISTLLLGFMGRRVWVSSRLERWLGRQRVHGVWWGTIESDYVSADGNVTGKIPIAFVIRQTYLTLSIQSYTERLPARSTMETLYKDAKTTDTMLSYVFEMRRTAQAENKITVGHGQLTVEDGGKTLSGDYWTNSPTQGHIRLSLVKRDCKNINSYRAAEAAWNGLTKRVSPTTTERN